ncbi:acyl-CoA reductase [Cupriavidus necator]|uniref:acyl-CoA reductase n=1 Tax=Cupriavidus necator TaxID=106590 RepID=UPI0039C0E2F6
MSTLAFLNPDVPGIPAAVAPEALAGVPVLPPYSDAALGFAAALSDALMHAPQARAYPELAALAFWLRRANLTRLRDDVLRQWQARTDAPVQLPRGTVLHFAPANVDTIFVYSWMLALLSGNRNIVRVSTRESPQAAILVETVRRLLADPAHQAIAQRTLLVRYAADEAVTARLSAVCDVRVIWGGDDTVAAIRRIALPPTATEICFPNKYSLALVSAAGWLAAPPARQQEWAHAFHNDAYWFGQMACSSPRLVLWIGERGLAREASSGFWERLGSIVAARAPALGDADYVNKLVAADALAIETHAEVHTEGSNALVRVWLDEPALHAARHCGAGLFFESSMPALAGLSALLDRSVQTVVYAGFDAAELRRFVADCLPRGIDRIVPFGKALAFAPVWDGLDLTHAFLREVSVS